ncbi:ricin-type beta-trefoil lectin domain protein [Actinoplanes sp. NBRC 103695]|uniref:ricin-type beta-trefoil lectin domain protein n=1 Tax=Actinoplanes sp. NBRC 103695 TaxID=3032202 RepID=UPI0024A4D96C|nr:ricin-type beta-trefoil lectin domain protein [Actinoplanes sp. NBRC 103695]GLY97269.1 hypothetical protein Acsp02_45230 [Actinoplanes sp. NBRC 103695]
MNRTFAAGTVLSLLSVTAVTFGVAARPPAASAHAAPAPAAGDPVPGSYVVRLADRPGLRAAEAVTGAARELTGRFGGRPTDVYTSALHGFSARLSPDQAADLADDPRVASVRQDVYLGFDAVQTDPPWNLDRVDQSTPALSGSFDVADASKAYIYVFDSGVRTTHTEFGGRVLNGLDGSDQGDCQGHGTAVAGAAASQTYGVAKNATVYAVRVTTGCDGHGQATNALKAIEWVTKNGPRPAVVNMSWGTGTVIQKDLEDAISQSSRDGITYVIAGSNSNQDACLESPQRTPEAITVGATDRTDRRAGFSNFGTCIDLFAPGTDIATTAWDSDTATTAANGTSLSAPLVTGAAAIYLSAHPDATPQQVRDALVGCAEPDLISDPGPGSPNRLLVLAGSCGATIRITNPGRQSTVRGRPVTITKAKATTASGTAPRYSATGLPAGVAIDASTGVISGTPATAGRATVQVTATDGTATVSTSFQWDVLLGYGPVSGVGGMCVDSDQGRLDEGNKIQLFTPCQQNWAARGDSTVAFVKGAEARCLAVSPAAGAPIVLSACTGADRQAWRAQADGTLRNPATGHCLTAPAAEKNVQLILAGCDGRAGQQWRLPSGVPPGAVQLDNPGFQVTRKGAEVWQKVTATTADSTQGLTFSAAGLPAGLSIDPGTGMISGTVARTVATTATVEVRSTAGTTATMSFGWQVADGVVSGVSGLCLDDRDGRTDDNNPIQLWSCVKAAKSQQIAVGTDNRLQLMGKCLTSYRDGPVEGNPIVLAPCGDAASQVWQPQTDGTLRNPASGKCLTAPAPSAGEQLIQSTCTGAGTQQWTLPTAAGATAITNPGRQDPVVGTAVDIRTAGTATGVTYRASGLPAGLSIDATTGRITGTPTTVGQGLATITAGTTGRTSFAWSVHHGQITGPGNLCVDDWLAATADGNKIVAYSCNAGNTQRWTVRADGMLETVGKCLTVAGDATTDGAVIVLYRCRGAGSQTWRPQSDGTLVNPVSGRCLAVPKVESNTQLTLAACTAAQSWKLPVTQPAAGIPVVRDPGAQRTTVGAAATVAITADGGTGPLSFDAVGLPAGLSIDAGTGRISETTAYSGIYPVTVSATAGTTNGVVSFLWAVYAPPSPTAITDVTGSWCVDTFSTVRGYECNRTAAQQFISSSDGRLRTADGRCLTPRDGGTSLAAPACDTADSTQTWRQQPDGTLLNIASGRCLTSDSFRNGAALTLARCQVTGFQLWTIPPTAPDVSSPGPQRGTVGTAVTLPISAKANGGGTLTYSATGLPAGLTINPATGVISGTPAKAIAATAVVTATEGSVSSTASFLWAVYGSPPVDVISDVSGSWCVDFFDTVRGWECNRTTAQRFTTRSDGRLQTPDTRCLTPQDGGKTLAVAACGAADATQVWRQQPDGTLLNVASSLCLTSDSFRNGAALKLDGCRLTALQLWSVPALTG